MDVESVETRSTASAPAGPQTFRPSWVWRLVNIVPIFGLLALATWVVSTGLSGESIGFAVVVLALGPWIAVRSVIARVSYSRSDVLVVGLLWSRRIQLDDIVSVEVEASSPSILWRTKGGRRFRTPLTVLASGYTILPSKVFRHRAHFLQRLSLWASAPL
jgi:hypothetical protein